MNTLRQRRGYLILGWVFAVLGAGGIFIPVYPSLLFFAIALVFLAKAKPRFRYLRMTLKRRYPRFARTFGEAELRAAQIARGEFIDSIRLDIQKGRERRRVSRLMRRRAVKAMRLGRPDMVDDLLLYVAPEISLASWNGAATPVDPAP